MTETVLSYALATYTTLVTSLAASRFGPTSTPAVATAVLDNPSITETKDSIIFVFLSRWLSRGCGGVKHWLSAAPAIDALARVAYAGEHSGRVHSE
jgi:hypothetical protein